MSVNPNHARTGGRKRTKEQASLVFWSAVQKSESCWEWTRATTPTGYGIFVFGKDQRAHRVSWVFTHGSIPDGMRVLHRCDNRKCVNPDHLFLGTQADNNADMVAKGRHWTRTKPEIIVRGEDKPNCKLNDASVRAIRADRVAGESIHALARRFGVSRNTVKAVLAWTTWRHVDQAEVS